MRTPTTTRPSAACSSSFAFSNGNSVRQGTQFGPQKLTMTGRPRRSARSNGSPSRVVPVISGTGSPLAMAPLSVGGRVRTTIAMTASVVTTAAASATMIGRRGGALAVATGLSGASVTLRPGDEVPKHQGGMDGALELVGSRVEVRDLVGLGLDPLEVVAVEDLRPSLIEDVDVVRCSLVLVVQRDREQDVRGGMDRLLVERHVVRDEGDPGLTGRTSGTWRRPRRSG